MGNKTNAMKHFIFREQLQKINKNQSAYWLHSWLSSRRSGVQIPVPPHQSLEPKHPYTPPPEFPPERNGVRESWAPGMTKKISQYSKCQTSESLWISLWRTRLWFLWKVLAAPHAVSLMMHDTISFIPCGVQFDRYCCSQLLLTSNKLWNVA